MPEDLAWKWGLKEAESHNGVWAVGALAGSQWNEGSGNHEG